MMKKYTTYLIVVLLLLTGCNDFLDVKPKGEVTEDKMFEDYQGFRDALAGAYASLAKESLYGNNLSYGFLDELSQLYYNYEASITSLELAFPNIVSYDYTNPLVEAYFNTIWGEGYQAISYLNNILRHVELRHLEGDKQYAGIQGEAYGLRAFIHFDLLRMYAPHILSAGADTRGIPYSYDYDLRNRTVYSLQGSYENIIKDLDRAESFFESDTSANSLYINKYAVHAIKARVYQNLGDWKNARGYAEKVINSEYYQLSLPTGISAVKKFPATGEMIWGLANTKLYNTLYLKFLEGESTIYTRQMVYRDVWKLYETDQFSADNNDYRYQAFFEQIDGGQYIFTRLLEEEKETDAEKENAIRGVCLIRLPEMYYIAAEGWYDEDPAKALSYLNGVRNSRGLKSLTVEKVNSKEQFLKELLNERKREFWGEGQIFLDHKRYRLGFVTPENIEINPSDNIFVFPWPLNEREFGDSYQ